MFQEQQEDAGEESTNGNSGAYDEDLSRATTASGSMALVLVPASTDNRNETAAPGPSPNGKMLNNEYES